MLIAIALYEGFTVLDAIGPYHALAGVPGHQFTFVAERPGMVSNGGSFSMEVPVGIDEISHVDLLLVPGGLAAITMAEQGGALVDWVRAMHETTTWTTSVCTGSLILGAAGALQGLRATSHWYAREDLARYGAIPTDERVVEDGKVFTAAGVSAGIDLGLTLVSRIAGVDYAQAVQLDMEYDPAPPFDAGHPRSAPEHVTTFVRTMYDGMLGRG